MVVLVSISTALAALLALALSACGGGDACGCLCSPDTGLVAPCSSGLETVDATAAGDDAGTE
jgi:hypothetical protein